MRTDCMSLNVRKQSMIKQKSEKMKQTNGIISDEQLAAYLEGALSEHDAELVKQYMDVDTLEVLNVSQRALADYSDNNNVLVSNISAGRVAAFVPINTCYNCCYPYPSAMQDFSDIINKEEENPDSDLEGDIDPDDSLYDR